MASAIFKDYYDRCFDRIEKSIHRFKEEHDPIRLFKFRTSIKRIRVCLACIEYHTGEKLADIRECLRKYFYESGKVRDTGMYRDWLLKHHFSELVEIMELDRAFKRKTKRFIHLGDKMKDDIRGIRKELHHLSHHLNQEKISEFYIELIHANLHLPFSHPPRRRWHAKRKNLKRIVYARNWQEGKALQLVSNVQADWMNRLQHLFGSWHDNEEMIIWMREQASRKRSHGVGDRFSKAIHLMREGSEVWVKKIEAQLSLAGKKLGPLQKRLERL